LWKRKSGEKESVSEFLIRLERVAYYLFVTRAGVNDRIARFAAVMNEIDLREGAKGNGLALADGEQSEFIQQLDGDIYLKSRVCKPVLQRLDEALSTGGASYDELVSIEHVLPQTVDDDSEWKKLFPDDEERAAWTHRLANLVFLTHRVNTRASNWDCERKKAEYFGSEDGSSPFVITQEVLRTKQWTLQHLIKRQSHLLQRLAEVWKLDISKVGIQESEGGLSSKGAKPSPDEIQAKRELIMRALSKRDGKELIQSSGALYSSVDGAARAVCTLSNRRPTGAPYWYGYSPQWDEYLSGASDSYLVLGSMDRNNAYAVPYSSIKKLLKHFHRTKDRHWHVELEENNTGQLTIVIPKSGLRFDLTEFEIVGTT
jgi:hypothetical protein